MRSVWWEAEDGGPAYYYTEKAPGYRYKDSSTGLHVYVEVATNQVYITKMEWVGVLADGMAVTELAKTGFQLGKGWPRRRHADRWRPRVHIGDCRCNHTNIERRQHRRDENGCGWGSGTSGSGWYSVNKEL